MSEEFVPLYVEGKKISAKDENSANFLGTSQIVSYIKKNADNIPATKVQQLITQIIELLNRRIDIATQIDDTFLATGAIPDKISELKKISEALNGKEKIDQKTLEEIDAVFKFKFGDRYK